MAIRIYRSVVRQTAQELFAEGGNLAVLLFQNPVEVLWCSHRIRPFKREPHNVYAQTYEECEQKLNTMIEEVKARIKAEKDALKGV